MSCGIYKITNLINNKNYIGQSTDIKTRWRHHRSYPQDKSHYPLYRAFSKYGIENFSFSILEECPVALLDEREIFYIKKYDSYFNGYNQTLGGSGHGHSVKLSEEDVEIIYDLLKNTEISQRQISEIFSIGEDTVSEINHGKTRVHNNVKYPLRNNSNKFYCKDCGKLISYGSIRCDQCNKKLSRVATRPSREQLKSMIRVLPFTTIAKQFNVSDNTIRKWCIAENLPFRAKDIKAYNDTDWARI